MRITEVIDVLATQILSASTGIDAIERTIHPIEELSIAYVTFTWLCIGNGSRRKIAVVSHFQQGVGSGCIDASIESDEILNNYRTQQFPVLTIEQVVTQLAHINAICRCSKHIVGIQHNVVDFVTDGVEVSEGAILHVHQHHT